MITSQVEKILSHYASDNPGVKANLARLFMHGELKGTGRLMILPIDQGFEHGPGRCFAMNPAAYDPMFHFQMAVDAGFSAFAAPLGMLEVGASQFAGKVPLVLKMNSSNSLMSSELPADQAITGSVDDALRLGCSAVGFTIYPGSDQSLEMYEEISAIIQEAKARGLAVIIWSYPRGNMSKAGETALDVISYGAHMACLLGAHIVKVKLPSSHLEMKEAKPVYEENHVPLSDLKDRVKHVVDCCFSGRRFVIFSGGESQSVDGVLQEVTAIAEGGGGGSIMGRNCFKRPRAEAMDLIAKVMHVYKTVGL